ncbi:nucleotide exchange factor GrpE [bacterium]|nr:nucleotide exchange factor GrpE [bacterium]
MSRKKKTEISINEDADHTEMHVEKQQEVSQNNTSEDLKVEDVILELKDQIQQEQDKRVRLLAEYDNYRKRTQNEFAHLITSANARLIKQLLPVLDDFDRLFDHNNKDIDDSSIVQGVEMIYRKLQSAMEAEGLKAINAIDSPFDAELHEAVAEIENNERPAGTVINEIEKGYLLGSNIIRHAKVVVSKEMMKKTEGSNE